MVKVLFSLHEHERGMLSLSYKKNSTEWHTSSEGCKILVAGGHNLFMSLLMVIHSVL